MRLLAVVTAAASLAAPPPPVAADFHVTKPGVALPTRCRPAPVARTLTAMLRALAAGDGSRFAVGFTSNGYFVPFGVEATGRGGIAAFVRGLRGEVWSAHALVSPLGAVGLPAEAVYELRLDAFHRGRLYRARAAKVVVSCGTGLVRQWVGPNVPR